MLVATLHVAFPLQLVAWAVGATASRSSGVAASAAGTSTDAVHALLASGCDGVTNGLAGRSADEASASVRRCARALLEYAGQVGEHSLASRDAGGDYAEDIKAATALVETLGENAGAHQLTFHSSSDHQQEALDSLLSRFDFLRKAKAHREPGGDVQSVSSTADWRVQEGEEQFYSDGGAVSSGSAAEHAAQTTVEPAAEWAPSIAAMHKASRAPCSESKEALGQMEGEIEELRLANKRAREKNRDLLVENERLLSDAEGHPDHGSNAARHGSSPEAEVAAVGMEGFSSQLGSRLGGDLTDALAGEAAVRVASGSQFDARSKVGEAEGRLLEQVAHQAAVVARISRELRLAESNGKRTIDIVETDSRDQEVRAGAAAQHLEAQRVRFVQVKEHFEKVGNDTARQRQTFAQLEEESSRARSVLEEERHKLETLRRQKQDADDAVAKAQVERTQTEKRLHMDTTQLQEQIAKLGVLNGELTAAQNEAASRVASSSDGDGKGVTQTQEEGFVEHVLHSVGLG